MFKVTIKIRPKAAKRAEALNSLSALSAAYHRSGQTVGRSIVSKAKGTVVPTGVVHERSSLLRAKSPSMTREAWRKLRTCLREAAAVSFESLMESPRTCQCSSVREDGRDGLSCRRCVLISEVSSDGQLPKWWRPLPRHRRGP